MFFLFCDNCTLEELLNASVLRKYCKNEIFSKMSFFVVLFWTKRGFLPMESLKNLQILIFSHVPDPGKGVCVDPVNGGAILGKGGPDPQGGNKERQLSPDKGREKT
jgi:hypothetical protein